MKDALQRIETVETRRELWQLVRACCAEIGVDRISYHHYAGANAAPDIDHAVRISADGFPQDWVCEYIEQKLYLVDPIAEYARSSAKPFRWEDIETLTRLTPAQLEFLDKRRAAGMQNGVAFQVYGPAMRNGYVGLGQVPGATPFTMQQMLLLQCIAQAAHLRYCELTPEEVAPPPGLSQREREILHWIAHGKSNSVIATILGVSSHTVDTIVRRIYAKLGVADRTSAAIKGVGSGLILPGV